MNRLPCGCCEGVEPQTPAARANRPGLPALRYRAGTHGQFLDTMKARLSSLVLDVPASEGGVSGRLRPLDRLRTREADDPAIALLDSWACVADVLSFYQERIANEGYLATATERLSAVQLARLIGYRPRPGVAASVHLAFTLETGYALDIPAGLRAQSVPAPGETMQSFEAAEAVPARTEWNNLAPRRGRPQVMNRNDAAVVRKVYLKGTATNLKKGDALLLVTGREREDRVLRFVAGVELQDDDDRTVVTLTGSGARAVSLGGVVRSVEVLVRRSVERAPAGATAANVRARLERALERVRGAARLEDVAAELGDAVGAIDPIRADAEERGFTRVAPWAAGIVRELRLNRELAERGALVEGAVGDATPEAVAVVGGGKRNGRLGDFLSELALTPEPQVAATVDLEQAFSLEGDALTRSFTIFKPALGRNFYSIWKRLPPLVTNPLEVYALRVVAAPFGYNAQKLVDYEGETARVKKLFEWPDWTPEERDESESTLFLDAAYEQVRPDGYVALAESTGRNEAPMTRIFGVQAADHLSRTAYGVSTKTTRMELDEAWWDPTGADDDSIERLRGTIVYAGSERLETADAPILAPIAGDEIELADLYDGIGPGRVVVVAGERALPALAEGTGVRVAELAVVAAVRQGPALLDPANPESGPLPGDRVHTTLLLTSPLTYRYVRDTAVVHGNVVRATHGESRSELLGSGDATKAFQRFTLRQSPLTYVSAPTAAGAETTLTVRVNDVRWREAESFLALGPSDRGYVAETGNDSKTTVTFGDGKSGARVPTGANNVTATYRTGIGRPGNVAAGSITLLASRPLGVKDVVNPLPATGGADEESRDDVKRNAPTAVAALDRLVSVSDYEDFSRVFAGVGKATAVRLPVGRRNVVHVTIAGSDDIPIAETSDLYRNLLIALRRFGDPLQAVRLAVRELVVPVLSARVRIHPDYLWTSVEPQIRTALREALGFDRRELARSLAPSEVLSVMQAVPGVVYVDLDTLAGLTEEQALQLAEGPGGDEGGTPTAPAIVRARPARLEDGLVRPAQLAYLNPELSSAIALSEVSE